MQYCINIRFFRYGNRRPYATNVHITTVTDSFILNLVCNGCLELNRSWLLRHKRYSRYVYFSVCTFGNHLQFYSRSRYRIYYSLMLFPGDSISTRINNVTDAMNTPIRNTI